MLRERYTSFTGEIKVRKISKKDVTSYKSSHFRYQIVIITKNYLTLALLCIAILDLLPIDG